VVCCVIDFIANYYFQLNKINISKVDLTAINRSQHSFKIKKWRFDMSDERLGCLLYITVSLETTKIQKTAGNDCFLGYLNSLIVFGSKNETKI